MVTRVADLVSALAVSVRFSTLAGAMVRLAQGLGCYGSGIRYGSRILEPVFLTLSLCLAAAGVGDRYTGDPVSSSQSDSTPGRYIGEEGV
ncbi:hypothetical protein L1987_13255 [Smallanthus sonchifolius]|uniref:Uncharacterized protein n=1 Tax=Smallanthus sonchifolius TaxID=185202 RepID=A0ACB9JIA8_9ASTR|nr:hypothetical protein L1987_13255 [Smallanthus sonchifolius]